MAGSYPDVPSRRMAWDDDGTVCLSNVPANGDEFQLSQVSAANTQILNDESSNGVSALYHTGADPVARQVHIFPELREVDGIFGGASAQSYYGEVATSGDSTNGLDGTFTQRIADLNPETNVYAKYRDSIDSMAVSNVRAVRLVVNAGTNSSPRAVHLYGEISSGQTPDRLLWIDNTTGLEFSLPIDYGDVPRGSAEDREVKLKNNSASLSAGSVQVTAEDLYLGSGAWYTFKEGAGSFQSTLSLASSIGSGASSPVITIRRIIPDAATVGLHAARAYANVGSWT